MSEDLDLLESGLYSDATITCGERTWKVHKNIIRRCEWFKKAFNGKFKVISQTLSTIPGSLLNFE